MAEINLLKQSSGQGGATNRAPKIFVRLLILVLLGLIGYYAWLYFSLGRLEAQAVELQQSMAIKKKEALELEGRDELLTRQAQIKALSSVINDHVYWSKLFPKLAEVTLKSASYSSLSVTSGGGVVTLETTVPTLADLDKFMQIFDLSEFNQNFSDIKITGYNKAQTETGSLLSFKVEMKYNPDIIKYSEIGR